MRIRRPAVEIRREQIYKQLDKLREEQAAETRKHYKSDHGYEQAHNRRADTIGRLEQELSMLNDPGEYNELPIVVVADELGLTMNQVSLLIAGGEIEASDESQEFVTRDDLARAVEVGVKELLRLLDQEAAEVFEQAVPHVQRGDIAIAEKEYKRLESRDSLIGPYAYAFRLALDLAKGELDGIDSSIRFISGLDSVRRTAIITYLGRILRGMEFNEHGAQVVAEHLLAICEGSDPYDDPESSWGERREYFKRLDDEQQRAMYIASVVMNALAKAHINKIRNYHTPKAESVVRNAIYTALHAEATYGESAASRMFVDMINAQIPKWYEPAKLLQNLTPKKKAASQD